MVPLIKHPSISRLLPFCLRCKSWCKPLTIIYLVR